MKRRYRRPWLRRLASPGRVQDRGRSYEESESVQNVHIYIYAMVVSERGENIHNACAAGLLEETTVVGRRGLGAAGEEPGLGGSEAGSGPGGLTEDLGVHLGNGFLVG